VTRRIRPLPFLVLAVLFLLVAPAPPVGADPAEEASERAQSGELYLQAEQALADGHHDRAIVLFRNYLDFTRSRAHRPERVFWAIDRVAWLQLGVKRDPDAALAFFEEIRSDPRLTEIDRGAISEWISVAREWKQEIAQAGSGPREAGVLLDRGRRYYESGLEKLKVGVAYFASADFGISSGYLRRFALLHHDHPRIGDVLFMLGAIRYHMRADEPGWSDNFYLKESIRRFPHSPLAVRSFDLLRREAGRVYKPAQLPPELAESLGIYEELARPLAPPAA
jgi:hypothetical protein